MKKNTKQRLFEVMGRLDSTFKQKINENFEFNDSKQKKHAEIKNKLLQNPKDLKEKYIKMFGVSNDLFVKYVLGGIDDDDDMQSRMELVASDVATKLTGVDSNGEDFNSQFSQWETNELLSNFNENVNPDEVDDDEYDWCEHCGSKLDPEDMMGCGCREDQRYQDISEKHNESEMGFDVSSEELIDAAEEYIEKTKEHLKRFDSNHPNYQFFVDEINKTNEVINSLKRDISMR